MRIAIMTAGSRGDVAPYTGLGAGLVRAGHEVTPVTHGMFEPLAAGSGVRFRPLPGDPRAELHARRGRDLHRSRTGAVKLLRAAALARRMAPGMTAPLVRAAREADVVLAGGALAPLGHAVAQGLSRPSMGLFLQPLHGTSAFPPPMLGTRSLGPLGNRIGGDAVLAAVDHVFTRAARRLAEDHGLPVQGLSPARRDRERQGWPVWHGFSELVVPRPRDRRPGLEVCGYWWPHDAAGGLPAELEDFLGSGPAPVYVGLGSATTPDPRRVSAHVVTALRACGLRGVVQHGWAGLSATGDDMITIGDVPHSLLFPRMAALVHHAGAGTTGATLRAGVPCVPLPVRFDAHFWASRLVELGTAPEVVPLRRLDSATLGAALRRAVTEPSHRDRARRIARRLAAEDGTAPSPPRSKRWPAVEGAVRADSGRPTGRTPGGGAWIREGRTDRRADAATADRPAPLPHSSPKERTGCACRRRRGSP
ncbi:glycosyltransferase [Streptomyces racemochromogenes]|uniref:Glycosyltransferase n=1 Tax=Streptomyces racemochromogenes TaxID=67353 RepID=A0ABW7PJV7_9ACTN